MRYGSGEVQGPAAEWPCMQCLVLVTRTMNNLWPLSMFICTDVLLLQVMLNQLRMVRGNNSLTQLGGWMTGRPN